MLNKDYKEILQLLLKNKVRFLVVGAYALGAYGYPRSTGDIDIWADNSQVNSKKIYKTLAEFGAPVSKINTETFIEKNIVYQIGVAPRRIDIITKIDGVQFNKAYKNKKTINIEGLKIPFLSKNDLIKNKKSTGRNKDKVDLEYLI